MPTSFGARLSTAFASAGQLCVGIDPHAELLESWGLEDSASGLESFSKTVIQAASGRVGIVKPQVSFFERHGSKGFAVLENLCVEASQAGLLVIMDAKRGDIGSTMDAYFDAWLGKAAPFLCDAVTVSPYLGFESLTPFLASAAERGKGVFVLAATSNPEAAGLQRSVSEAGKTVAQGIWEGLNAVNGVTAHSSIGDFGAVIGATVNPAKYGIELGNPPDGVATPILAPGFGAQGARLQDLGRLFGGHSGCVIANVSRSVLSVGALLIEEAIDNAKAQLAEGLA